MKNRLAVMMVLFVALIQFVGQLWASPRVYIEPSATVDASNAKDKAKQVDFSSALSAALHKKKTPVTVVTDKAKSNWTIQSMSSQKEDSTGTKVTKIIAFGAFAGSFTQ